MASVLHLQFESFARRSGVRVAPWLFAILLVGCAGGGTEPGPSPGRAFRLGFSALPPAPDQNLAVQSLQLWTQRADIAIVHEELPWSELVAGTPPATILARDKDGLIQYYRGKGLALVFVAHADDGLSRGEEAPQLRALGRSITEPAIQQLYRDWIKAFVTRYHPEYVGLAAETNLIRWAAPPALYAAVVSVANAAAADLRALPSPPPLFVSVQVEVAWGKLINQPYQGIETDFRDFPFVDLIGLSSYPYFGWPDPDALPDDYYSRLLGGRTLPTMVVEGGWASAGGTGFTSSPAVQARYFVRQAKLLAGAGGIGWLQLEPVDIDLATFPTDIQPKIAPFSTLGIFDPRLNPKPALAVWDSLFHLPRRP